MARPEAVGLVLDGFSPSPLSRLRCFRERALSLLGEGEEATGEGDDAEGAGTQRAVLVAAGRCCAARVGPSMDPGVCARLLREGACGIGEQNCWPFGTVRRAATALEIGGTGGEEGTPSWGSTVYVEPLAAAAQAGGGDGGEEAMARVLCHLDGAAAAAAEGGEASACLGLVVAFCRATTGNAGLRALERSGTASAEDARALAAHRASALVIQAWPGVAWPGGGAPSGAAERVAFALGRLLPETGTAQQRGKLARLLGVWDDDGGGSGVGGGAAGEEQGERVAGVARAALGEGRRHLDGRAARLLGRHRD